MLSYNYVQTNKYKLKKGMFQWSIENKAIIVIKHLQINKILALNNPLGVDMLLNKLNFLLPGWCIWLSSYFVHFDFFFFQAVAMSIQVNL